MYGLEIQKLQSKIELVNDLEDKLALIQQAIHISDTNNDIEWSIELRLELMNIELETTHDNLSLQAIGWIIHAYEQDPSVIEEVDFLWQYKWMVNRVIRNPELTNTTVKGVIDDFSKRMERNSFSLRSVYECYLRLYTDFGIEEQATKYKELRNGAANDGMTDCQACELDTSVSWDLTFDSIGKAKHNAADILSKKLSCNRIPIITYARFVEELTLEGKLEEAKEFYEEGMKELLKDDFTPRNFEFLLQHAYYMSKVDNKQAWKLIGKHYFDAQPSTYLMYKVNVNMLAILKNTPENTIHVTLPSWLPFYTDTNTYNKDSLYKYYYKEAKAIAEKMASREGISEMATFMDKRIELF